MREIRTLRLIGRGLETGLRRTYTGTKLETADTAKGSLRGTAPVLDPTTQWKRGAPERPDLRGHGASPRPYQAPARLRRPRTGTVACGSCDKLGKVFKGVGLLQFITGFQFGAETDSGKT